jgi:hypothetical protein
MSKHTVFFVHGVGDDAKGWSKNLREEFKALFDSYPLPPGGKPFDEIFLTEEILYNDLFDLWRARAAQDAEAAIRELGGGGLPQNAVTRLLEAGASAGGGGFLRTHALDVLQYRYLRLVSESIRSAVEFQIMRKLPETQFGTPVRWSIVAHSLGSSVVHDTLHEMFSPGAGAQGSALFQPFAVVMLANVSQLLHNENVLGQGIDAYSSFVKPNRETDQGACRYYLSAANKFDPIALAGDFKPPANWLADSAKAQRRYRPLGIEAIPKNRQVHGFSEYLAHPGVHVPLFRILSGDPDRITDAQEDEAHAKYRAANPLPDVANAKRVAIEKLTQRAAQTDWFERLLLWKDVIDEFGGL